MANTDIKWYSSKDLNAPSLPADWNVLTNVLDACLINGYSSQSFSRVNISDGVAVATFNTNHSFKQFQVIEITGSENTTLNKEFKILGVSATTVEFLIDLPDAVYTGVMSARLAPLGWSKPFSDAGRGIYRAKNIEKNPFFLRVDGTKDPSYTTAYTKFAKVGILESCLGIDDVAGIQAPFNESSPLRNWKSSGDYHGYAKWKYATIGSEVLYGTEGEQVSAGVRSWILIGDDTSFYLVINSSLNSLDESVYGFGSVQTNSTPRPFLLSTLSYDTSGNYYTNSSALVNSALNWVSCIYDYSNNIKSSEGFKLITGFSVLSSGSTGNSIKPDPIQGYYLTPYYLLDPTNLIMGELPIVRCCINNTAEISNKSYYADSGDIYYVSRYSARRERSLAQGMLFFKISGDD